MDGDASCPATETLMRRMVGPAPALSAAWPDSLTGRASVHTLAGFGVQGEPLIAVVSAAGETTACAARTVVPLTRDMVGRQVLVIPEADGPIVTGVMQPPAAALPEPEAGPAAPFELLVEGQRVILDVRDQLVLRCGEASITLTREGKILLHGTYISSRSRGVHRISGGSIELN